MIKHKAQHYAQFQQKLVTNALNPILYLSGMTLSALFFIDFQSQPLWFNLILLCSPIITIAVAIFSYLFFMIKDPDRLQSETYQLKKQALELIEEKGQPFTIDAASIATISNPELPSLSSPKKEEISQ